MTDCADSLVRAYDALAAEDLAWPAVILFKNRSVKIVAWSLPSSYSSCFHNKGMSDRAYSHVSLLLSLWPQRHWQALTARSSWTRTSSPNTMADTTKHPLFGFIRRKVTAKQVQRAIVRADLTLFHIVSLDVLAGWQGKPVHSLAAFWSILQNARGSKKVASICADGWIL